MTCQCATLAGYDVCMCVCSSCQGRWCVRKGMLYSILRVLASRSMCEARQLLSRNGGKGNEDMTSHLHRIGLTRARGRFVIGGFPDVPC